MIAVPSDELAEATFALPTWYHFNNSRLSALGSRIGTVLGGSYIERMSLRITVISHKVNVLIRRMKRRMKRRAAISPLAVFSASLFDAYLRFTAVSGFISRPCLHGKNNVLLDTRRFAKKSPTTRKSGATNRSGAGFGSNASKTRKSPGVENGDYSVFPRLEPNVLETLIPSPTSTFDSHGGGALPEEMYQRLDQIYGLANFNFDAGPATKETRAPLPASLTEMLSVQSDPTSTSNPTSLRSHLCAIPAFSQFRVLHVDPLVLAIDGFMTMEECDAYVDRSLRHDAMHARSPTVGKDTAAQAQRTSTTWYHYYSNVPELMAKASRLLGLSNIDHWEEPQTVRYRRKEKFTWHLDALGPSESLEELGGQRTATLLVYLTDLEPSDGGATLFRDLRYAGGSDQCLRVQPRKGTALLFFPSAGGIPSTPFDIRTLHCGDVVSDSASQDKWIAQLWLRSRAYTPTAPPGNVHENAFQAIAEYCSRFRITSKYIPN
jgi:2OG-Fe(II) oxygenase superfamily